MSHTRNSNWTKKLKNIRNSEALPPVIIRAIWTRYSCGQTPEKIYKKLKEERQISASLETIETYIAKVVKPYFDKKESGES
ncbi:hypothetical protein [Bacillus cereus]|uniref:Transposase n=1 Tax=Bacillus cereus TaxID=1396 RepID=A0A2A7HQ74_BACCE|nr:hypothetical protein [Bacillus cereus]PEC18984.1 hypothetical protein COM96_27575 [Bacillus cereus]